MPGITRRVSQLFGGTPRSTGGAGTDPSRQATVESTTPSQIEEPVIGGGDAILNSYVRGAPSGRQALEIFAGEWSSRLPPPYDVITGSSELFEDARIKWILEVVGGVQGYRILELGPLEAGHTTMLERAGAGTITAVEGNTRAFLKCLIVKEVLGLERSHFLCGDIHEFLTECTDQFDLCLASGVLYHMRDPVAVLQAMTRVSDRLALWTHYYDPAVLDHPEIAVHFGSATERAIGDLTFTEHRYEYGEALTWNGFCGGSAHYANWLERDTILECLRRAGFDSIEIGFDEAMAQHGPALALVAQRG
jgi:SAM-dependent methyltransferase